MVGNGHNWYSLQWLFFCQLPVVGFGSTLWTVDISPSARQSASPSVCQNIHMLSPLVTRIFATSCLAQVWQSAKAGFQHMCIQSFRQLEPKLQLLDMRLSQPSGMPHQLSNGALLKHSAPYQQYIVPIGVRSPRFWPFCVLAVGSRHFQAISSYAALLRLTPVNGSLGN